jgi:hypothetical protein
MTPPDLDDAEHQHRSRPGNDDRPDEEGPAHQLRTSSIARQGESVMSVSSR